MKVFRDNVCYVDFIDITRYAVPSYFVMDKKVYEDGEMVVLNDSRSIEYIRNREDILDFDDVSKLDEQGLNFKIKETHDLLETYAKRLLDLPIHLRNLLYSDESFRKEYKIKKYIYYSLLDYKQNKESINNFILKFISNKKPQFVARNTSKRF